MFKPDENVDRKSYRELLMPPEGYQLEKAVGTTYSLDLTALIAALVCLTFSAETDSKFIQNPIMVFYTLQKVFNKVRIFCEAGQINIPSDSSALFLLLEKIIIPVALPKNGFGRYPAFHPKTWLLAFSNTEGKKKYRFVVLSKNLTLDRSWDVSFSAESSEKIRQTGKTKPILDFLDFLKMQADYSKQNASSTFRILTSFKRELRNVSFALESREFKEEFQIIPLGIGAKSYKIENDTLFCGDSTSADYSFHDLVILSPFLSGRVIEKFNRKERGLAGCTRVLITRKSELSRLKETQVDQFKLYTLKNDIVDGEDYLSDEDNIKMKQDIHAKLYLRRKNTKVDLYLGSMNASFSALHQNVELMVKLSTTSQYLNAEKLLNELFCISAGEAGNPFEQVSLAGVQEDKQCHEENLLEQKIKDLCRRKMKAIIEPEGEMYRIIIQVSGVKLDKSITISPFNSRKKRVLNERMIFDNMRIFQLSEFYQVCARTKETCVSRIIMIPTVGIPGGRENAVVNAVIKDRASFAEYISFVLSEDVGDGMLSLLEEKKIRESGLFIQTKTIMPALYERMLRTALKAPQRLKEIEDIMNRIDDNNSTIIPDTFKETYKTFCRALPVK